MRRKEQSFTPSGLDSPGSSLILRPPRRAWARALTTALAVLLSRVPASLLPEMFSLDSFRKGKSGLRCGLCQPPQAGGAEAVRPPQHEPRGRFCEGLPWVLPPAWSPPWPPGPASEAPVVSGRDLPGRGPPCLSAFHEGHCSTQLSGSPAPAHLVAALAASMLTSAGGSRIP